MVTAVPILFRDAEKVATTDSRLDMMLAYCKTLILLMMVRQFVFEWNVTCDKCSRLCVFYDYVRCRYFSSILTLVGLLCP